MPPESNASMYARRREEALQALIEMAELARDDPERERLRLEVIHAHMPYARHLAGKYGARGETAEDVLQAAYLGLTKAVDNFDPSYGAAFLTYATPMILGEIKRYYRDSTWAVHVPRRMRELTLELKACVEDLGQRLGRSPTVEEIAEQLEVDPSEIVDALDASSAHATTSLALPLDSDSVDSATLGDLLGAEDPSIETVINREALRPALAKLGERDKQILLMRFFRGMTQAQIAAELGVSQMQVSRLLSQIVAKLRSAIGLDQPV